MVAPATGSGLTRTTEDLDMPRVLWSERQPGEVPRPVAERQQLTTASPVVLPDPEAVMQDVAKQVGVVRFFTRLSVRLSVRLTSEL